MKKLVFVAIATVSSLLSVNAQSMQFGAKAGANFANLTGDIEDTKTKISFHVGGVAEFMLSDKFAFQPELLYSSQGAKQEISEGEGAVTIVTSTLDYLNIPLMGKLYIMDGLSLQAGPQIGFLMSSNQETDNPEVMIEESYKGIDFGLNIGVGYKLPSGLFFDARYNLGLADINDIADSDLKFKNAVIQLSLGYFF